MASQGPELGGFVLGELDVLRDDDRFLSLKVRTGQLDEGAQVAGVNSRKKTVQLASLSALGALGDPKAIAVLEKYATASKNVYGNSFLSLRGEAS